MTIKYVGLRATANFKYPVRLAEISYNDESIKDSKIAERVIKVLRIRGYEIDDGIAGWAAIRVNDKEDFTELMEHYKEIKQHAQLQVKYGF